MQYRHRSSGHDARAVQLTADVLERIGAGEPDPDWPEWFASACLRGAVQVRGGPPGEASPRFVVNAPNGVSDETVGDWLVLDASGRLRAESDERLRDEYAPTDT